MFKPFHAANAQYPMPHFMTELKVYNHPHLPLGMSQCHFDLNQFSLDCFNTYSMHMPSSIKNAVAKRQAEYFCGRLLSRIALTDLGFPPHTNIPSGKHREPIWPHGICGAISHSHHTAVVIVGIQPSVSAVGIDCEQWLSDGTASEIGQQIHTSSESLPLLNQGLSSTQATSLLFSAKESIFKALFPRVKQYFGFEQARLVSHSPDEDTLVFELTPEFAAQHKLEPQWHIQYKRDNWGVVTLLIES